jgi:hypothetical protein
MFDAVIASESKQYISPQKGRMDCLAALAMTWIDRSVPDTPPEPVSRRASRPKTARPAKALGGAEQSNGTMRPFEKQMTAQQSDIFLFTRPDRNRDDLISTYEQPTN